MSRMRSVDLGTGFADAGRWIAPPSLSMCEPAQVLNGGEGGGNTERRLEARNETRSTKERAAWPFLYSYRGGRCFVNAAPKKTTYAQAADVGEALI